MRSFAYVSLLALPVALSACSPKPEAPVARNTLPVFAVDLAGAAKLCTVTDKVEVKPGAVAEATMTVGNDGGWCGINVAQAGPAPFDYGLVARADRPKNGKVYVHAVGDYTRIDYTPDLGFVGTDSFMVELRPGAGKVKVAVTVQGVAQPAAVTPLITAPPPAPVASKPAANTTRRR
ncbi:hypothetical protein IAI18_22200 [Acetobacteraceae bacterium H6797]|nr:hypothetical protein [Acetobacteraceae bacterium H6797]